MRYVSLVIQTYQHIKEENGNKEIKQTQGKLAATKKKQAETQNNNLQTWITLNKIRTQKRIPESGKVLLKTKWNGKLENLR